MYFILIYFFSQKLFLRKVLKNFFYICTVLQIHKINSENKSGESGYRSQYLPHAKWALYHLS